MPHFVYIVEAWCHINQSQCDNIFNMVSKLSTLLSHLESRERDKNVKNLTTTLEIVALLLGSKIQM